MQTVFLAEIKVYSLIYIMHAVFLYRLGDVGLHGNIAVKYFRVDNQLAQTVIRNGYNNIAAFLLEIDVDFAGIVNPVKGMIYTVLDKRLKCKLANQIVL